MFIFGFNKLNFFNLFSEYFIGIMTIYVFVVFVLITSNIYGIVFQNVISKIFSFLLLLSCFFFIEELNFFRQDQFNFVGFNKFISLNSLTTFSKIFVSVFSFIYLQIISDYLNNYKIIAFEYLILLIFAILGLLFLCCTNDLLSTFLAIELISLSSYFLSAFKKLSNYSIEAGIKYLIIGALSSSFFLFGSSFIYGYSGSINLNDICFITADLNQLLLTTNHSYLMIKNSYNLLNNFYVEIGIILVILSLFIKLALAPFHVWSIDVYEGSPSISTFFFSTMTKLSFFIFFYRFCFLTFNNSFFSESLLTYFLFVGFMSILIGTFGGVQQKKIKSLLAFSSISHMGYCLLALNSFSKIGFEIFYFYIISYILANIIVWYVILSLKKVDPYYNKKLSKNIGDFVLLNKSNSFLALALCLSFFSLAGIPPLLGFIAKLSVFINLILEEFYLTAILIILCGSISTFYYLRVIKILYFENLKVGVLYSFNSSNSVVLCFLVFLLIFLFLKPTLFFLLIHKTLLFENF